MTEREKIIEVIAPYVSAYGDDEAIADALIAAGFGDVTEWKEKAKKEKDEKNMWKCTANDWKQRFESRDKQYNDGIVSSCKALQLKDEKIVKYKHRAEVAERALLTACVNLIKGNEDDVSVELLVRVVYTNYLRKAEKELTEGK